MDRVHGRRGQVHAIDATQAGDLAHLAGCEAGAEAEQVLVARRDLAAAPQDRLDDPLLRLLHELAPPREQLLALVVGVAARPDLSARDRALDRLVGRLQIVVLADAQVHGEELAGRRRIESGGQLGADLRRRRLVRGGRQAAVGHALFGGDGGFLGRGEGVLPELEHSGVAGHLSLHRGELGITDRVALAPRGVLHVEHGDAAIRAGGAAQRVDDRLVFSAGLARVAGIGLKGIVGIFGARSGGQRGGQGGREQRGAKWAAGLQRRGHGLLLCKERERRAQYCIGKAPAERLTAANPATLKA